MHTPHIPAYTLNLINHTKLHLNRGNRKKAEEERRKKGKKKEQESAEAISGLKIVHYQHDL